VQARHSSLLAGRLKALRLSPDFLVAEAVECYLKLQVRQIAHIEDGLADRDAGRVHTHEEIEDLVREFERLADEEASP
jgi:predicted transcriptional regulator